MRTHDGERHVGALGSNDTAGELNVSGPGSVTLFLQDVVAITPANEDFWSQWEGLVHPGYDFAKASDTARWTLSGVLVRRAERLDTRLRTSSYFSSAEGADDASRHSASVDLLRFYGRRWGLVGLGQLERNDELQLALRSQVGGGYRYRAVETNAFLLETGAGLVFNREEFFDDTPRQNTAEAVIEARAEIFRFDTPKTDVTTGVRLLPSLTDRGRHRLDLDIRLTREVVSDLVLSVVLQSRFDSRPPSVNAARQDFNVVSAFGWSF